MCECRPPLAVQGCCLLDPVGPVMLYELLWLRTVLRKGEEFNHHPLPLIKDLPRVGLADVANKNIEHRLN